MQKRSKLFFLILCSLFLLTLIVSIAKVGSPWQEQKRLRDQTRVNDLSTISNQINSTFRNTNQLTSSSFSLLKNYKDPKSGDIYSYSIDSDTQYQLCAIFETDNQPPQKTSLGISSSELSIAPLPTYGTNYHTAGHYCFTYYVTPKPMPVSQVPFSGVWNFDSAPTFGSYASTPGKIGRAAQFSPKQIFSLGQRKATNFGSIALWIKPDGKTDQLPGYKGYGTFFGRQITDTSSNLIFGFDSPQNGRAQFWLGHRDSTPYIISKSSIPSGEWTHLAVTWNGSLVKLYVNGVKEAEIQNGLYDTGPNAAITSSYGNIANPNTMDRQALPVQNVAVDGDITVGGVIPAWNGYFSGAIDELYLLDHTMSDPEVFNLANPTPSPAPTPHTVGIPELQ